MEIANGVYIVNFHEQTDLYMAIPLLMIDLEEDTSVRLSQLKIPFT